MANKYKISEEGLNKLQEARRTNRDKSVERRLHALILHAEGNTGKKISELTGYNEKVGHETGHGQIHFVLHRHGWSKKLPRNKHPKSAKPEAMEASKKLTLVSTN